MDKEQKQENNEIEKELDLDELEEVTGGSIQNTVKKPTVSKSKDTNSKL